MNICKCFKCCTCGQEIDCRIGMSNRDIQPFQFACPTCEERISFTLGTKSIDLEGAKEILHFKAPFEGVNPFIDLHLDFPVFFSKYEKGNTPFFQATSRIGYVKYLHHNQRLNELNVIYKKKTALHRLIKQYKRNDIPLFTSICNDSFKIKVQSEKEEDVITALYKAISLTASPFTSQEDNKSITSLYSKTILGLAGRNKESFDSFIKHISETDFLKNLQNDCLDIYPRILNAELPLRPALFLDFEHNYESSSVPSRVSVDDFSTYNQLYQDIAEVLSRAITIVAALNNLIKRDDHNLFSEEMKFNNGKELKYLKNIHEYSNIDLGSKIKYIDDSWYPLGETIIDNKLRNAIAHYKYIYTESKQLITYYPSKEGLKREKFLEIQFLDFMRKLLMLFRELHSLHNLVKCLFFYIYLPPKKNTP